jgi:hypothetical protein
VSDNPRYVNAGNESPDWMQIRILVPPGTNDREMLNQIINRFGFEVVDWCLWEAEHGSRLDIAPVPAPGPHGFEESVKGTRSWERS